MQRGGAAETLADADQFNERMHADAGTAGSTANRAQAGGMPATDLRAYNVVK